MYISHPTIYKYTMKKFTFMALLLTALPAALWAQDCPAVPAPFTLDFESATVPALPACTTQGIGFGTQWATVNNPGHGFTDVTLQRGPSIESSQSWFFTQGIVLTPGTYTLSYRYGNDSTTTTEKLRSVLVTDPQAPINSYIGTHDAITGGVPVDFRFQSPITITETATYYIGLNAYSDPEQGTLYVDNISLQELVCGTPEDFSVTNITSTSATLNWLPQAGAVTIGYFYGISVTDNPPANPQMTSNLTTDISSLTPGTIYYAYVQTFCGNSSSDWISTQFTTPGCAPVAAPYSLDFESNITVPAIPDCTYVGTFDTGNNWRTTSNPGSGFTSNALYYPDSDEPAVAWFFTQGITLEAGHAYRFSYKYGNDSSATTERLRTAMVTNPNAAFVNDTYLTDHPEITNGIPVNFSYPNPISISTTGVYYFGFNAYSQSEEGSLFVDDIAVVEWACNAPQNVTADDVSDTTATLNWGAQTEPTTISYYYGYGTTNTPPTDIIMVNGLTANLSNLAPDTTYYAYVRTFCGPIWSDWEVTEFTTEAAAGVKSVAFNNFKAFPNPVANTLTVSNTLAIDKIELYNLTGQLVFSQKIGTTNADINLENLSAGIYVLTAYAGENSKKVKIVKQ